MSVTGVRGLSLHRRRSLFASSAPRVAPAQTQHEPDCTRSLRHTAAYRMARDPQVPLTDVQWVMGHAHLSTTQRYLNPVTEDVIAGLLALE